MDERQGRRLTQKLSWHALAELALQTGTPIEQAFMPTTNHSPDKCGDIINDWLLVNEAWKDGYIPGTYKVYPPESSDPKDFLSDHRVVAAKLGL